MPTADLFGYTPPIKTWEQGYKEYTSSKGWKIKCNQALEQADYKCEVCGFSKHSVKLSVHHLTYERFKYELPEDLKVVCKKCHDKEDIKRAKRTEERNYKKYQDARFDGWARKVYGDDWMIYNNEDVVYAEFEAWLDTIYD